jgi:Family of unknown function (DUF6335)
MEIIMSRKKKEQFTDLGRAEREIFEPSAEVKGEFYDAAQLGSEGQLRKKLQDHHATSPTLSGGDIDAAWEDADVGEESVGGGNPTPDQNVVDDLGKAMGVSYGEGEPLHTTEKLEARDKHRWELDPASSEGFAERMKREGEYEEQ